MKTLLKYISFTGFGLMIVASILVFNDEIERRTYEVLALVGTGVWFVPVPWWMKRRLHHSE